LSRYHAFDRSQIELADLGVRGHDLTVEKCQELVAPANPFLHPEFPELVQRIHNARGNGRPVIVMVGAHPFKLGLSRYLIDLVARGIVTHVATNGAGLIHDFELACFGGTSENVARWIKVGQFGLWNETSGLNDVAVEAARRNEGLGEAIGRTIHERNAVYAHLSLAACGWQHRVPVTCHVSIGSDIVHSMPNCDGAAWGQASYTDFLIFTAAMQELEGGVFLNIGSAVTGPEVYLKALSMVRNVARRHGVSISRFTTAVFDLLDLPPDFRSRVPPGSDAHYYYRPWKTILVRTVADGGTSYYFNGHHSQTIPTLWSTLVAPLPREPITK